MLEVAERLSHGPAVLVLDDVHWADDATLNLLPRLSSRFRREPLLLLVAGGPQPASEGWRLSSTLARYCPTTDLLVRPLAPAESRALVSRILGQALPPDVEPTLASAGGNPMLLTRMAEAVRAAGRHSSAQSSETPWPRTLPVGQIPHLSYLSDECVRFLELAAVLNQGFATRELGVVTGLPFQEVVGLVREAVGIGVLEDNAGKLRFRHGVVRSTLAAELPLSVRSDLHRLAADDLAESGRHPSEIIDHLIEATLVPADFTWVRSVASASTADRALDLWTHFVDEAGLEDPYDPQLSDVQAQMAIARFSLGQTRQAEDMARRLLDGGIGRDPHAIRTCLAMSLLIQGRWDEARAVAEASTADLHPWEGAEDAALAAAATLASGDDDGASELLRRAERAALAAGSHRALTRVLVTGGHQAHRRGDLRASAVLLRQGAARTANESPHGADETFAHALLGLVLIDLDRTEDAEQVFREGIRQARARGSVIAARATRNAQAMAAASLGLLDEAAATMDDALSAGGEPMEVWRPVQLATRSMVALRRDGPAAAESWVRTLPSREKTSALGYGTAWLACARGAVSLARGEAAYALNELWRGWEDVAANRILVDHRILAYDLMDAALRMGDRAKAHAVVESMAELAARNPEVISLEVAALRLRGLVADDLELLTEAAAKATQSPRVLAAGWAAESAAIYLARSGYSQRAHQLGRDAIGYFARAGAGFEAARTRAALRRAGIRVREPARTRPRAGWEALTPTEQIVARYVEQGMSNGDIADELVLSRRTVETHMSHILSKLRLRSRADLIIDAARKGRIPNARKGPEARHR